MGQKPIRIGPPTVNRQGQCHGAAIPRTDLEGPRQDGGTGKRRVPERRSSERRVSRAVPRNHDLGVPQSPAQDSGGDTSSHP